MVQKTPPNNSRPLSLLRLMRAMGFVWRSSRRWAAVNFALLGIQSVLPPLGLYLAKQMVNSVVTGLKHTDAIHAAFTQTFLVSHRFMSVKDADCIYVMDSGRILEYGSHDELLRHDGLYASMYHKQAAGFK